MAEPRRVLADPGMVRRALEGHIHSHFESMLGRTGDESPEIGQRPEFGIDGVVATVRRTDRPRAARLSGLCRGRVVAPFAMRHPDRILTSEQIRAQIWSLDSDSFSNVVAAQMRLLRRKLADIECKSSIETVRGVGYRFVVN